MTTEFEIGGPPVPSISTAPIMAFCRDSSCGLDAVKNKTIAGSQIFSERANTHPSCQNSSCVCRRELKKNWSAAHSSRTHSPLRKVLLGFAKPASTGGKLDAIERAFAVDVPPLFQVVERTGFRVRLNAIHPFCVVTENNLPLRIAFHDCDGGRVLVDHMDRSVQLPLLGFLVFC